MSRKEQELFENIGKCMMAMRCEIDRCCLLMSTVRHDAEGQPLPELPVMVALSCQRTQRLKEAVAEAIEVLDESRKAFKSKRLEILRKKLTQVLIEAE